MSPAKKTSAKKTSAKKTSAKKTSAKKTSAKKAPARRVEDPAARRAAARARRARRAAEPGLPPGEMLTMEVELPVTPDRLYDAWLDPARYAAMTGERASGEAAVGATFTTHGGEASGVYLELFPKERIVMSFRTKGFGDAPDSLLDLLMSPAEVDGTPGTRLFLIHSSLPAQGASTYASFWAERAFAPMSAFFAARAPERR